MQANSQGLIYSAEVLDSTDQPLPKVVHQNTTYIIGTAGEAFHIRARVCYRKASPLARPEKPLFKIYAKVDGESVGYTKICYAADNICGKEDKLSDSVIFWGRAGGPGLKHNFTFARPESRASNAPGTRMLPAHESAIGTIVLRFREAKSCSPGVKPPEENSGGGVPEKEKEIFVLDDGERKPIMMPSLMAGSDQVLKSRSRRERAEVKAEGKYSTVDLTCR